jgi:glycosyltransferase involved in cell wall biosynthesis
VDALGRASAAPALVPWLWRNVPGFDLVHVHLLWSFPGMLASAVCRARGVPHVVSPHGALDPWALEQRALEKKLFLAAGERRNLETAAFLHFTTGAERAVAPGWARALPAEVIPLAVDAAPFLALGRGGARASSREVLLLARVHPMKGFDVLLPAWRRVVAAEPRARLVVAGRDEGGYRARVEALAEAAGVAATVVFTGHLDERGREEVLARAALLVAPSHRENFGLAVAEAMAAGLPVVVSDRVNICDDIAAAGAGEVVPLAAEPLAAGILRLLGDPVARAAMGARGRALVAERYAPAAVGAAMRAAYEGLLAAPGVAQRRASRSSR